MVIAQFVPTSLVPAIFFVSPECALKTGNDGFVWMLGQLSIIVDVFVLFFFADQIGASLVSRINRPFCESKNVGV